MITDERMIDALKTVRQYCCERDSCDGCVFEYECEGSSLAMPQGWELPGDDDDDE